jgi:hypothetical protein
MAFKFTPEKWAGIAYLAPSAAVGGIWAVLLLVSNPSKSGPIDIGFLRYALFEERERWFFWWLATLPIACLLLSVSYFSAIARAKVGAITLSTIGVVLAVVTWFTMDWTIALFVTAPLLFSVPSAKNAI